MGFVATRGNRDGQCQRAPRGVGQISGQQILKEVLKELCKEEPSGVPTTTAMGKHVEMCRQIVVVARQVTASLTSSPSVAPAFAPQKTDYGEG